MSMWKEGGYHGDESLVGRADGGLIGIVLAGDDGGKDMYRAKNYSVFVRCVRVFIDDRAVVCSLIIRLSEQEEAGIRPMRAYMAWEEKKKKRAKPSLHLLTLLCMRCSCAHATPHTTPAATLTTRIFLKATYYIPREELHTRTKKKYSILFHSLSGPVPCVL